METLDTEKLKEVLDMMVESGAVFLKYGELIIEFPRESDDKATSTDAIGFEAEGVVEQNRRVQKQLQDQANLIKPVGYTALFGDNKPTFPRPIAQGQHV